MLYEIDIDLDMYTPYILTRFLRAPSSTRCEKIKLAMGVEAGTKIVEQGARSAANKPVSACLIFLEKLSNGVEQAVRV